MLEEMIYTAMLWAIVRGIYDIRKEVMKRNE